MVVPDWLQLFPSFMDKFQKEISMAPGSLAEEIWCEANDPEINPEIMWHASTRVSNDICDEEKAFLQKRKLYTIEALSSYLEIDKSDIHPHDVPIIAICVSGGGIRAVVAGSGYYSASHETGLFDCATYTAGVSGSCWLQTLFFSSLGRQNHKQIIQHLKNRLGVHLAYPPAAFDLIGSAPTNKFLLTGLVEKLKGSPDADFGIVDIYGMLLASRLMVPKAGLAVDFDDLKLSNQTKYLDRGQNPLPIYTAVRHEISQAISNSTTVQEKRHQSWFQWFEFTPYEFWSEEIGAGIPSWAVGRHFQKGKATWRPNGLCLPEVRIPLLLGIWGSAFCATLSHYYKEIRPVMKRLSGFSGIDQMISERDEDLIKVHPIDPAAIPNFALGMQDQLPASCPESLYTAPYLQLMDAGMSNNLPIYPLLRPGREVDIVITFDASADVKTDNWLRVVEGYARQRNIIGWPVGAGWPPANETIKQTVEDLENAQPRTKSEEIEKANRAMLDISTASNHSPSSKDQDLGYCNIWVGSTAERSISNESLTSTRIEENWDSLTDPDAGITVIYFPLLANPKVDGVDPKISDYLSTWNFIYTPEQVEKVVNLARANFEDGKERTRRTIRAVYERKKKLRLQREAQEKMEKRTRKMRLGIPPGRNFGEGDHGDHFS
jgi:cytosolic phospholipase A2